MSRCSVLGCPITGRTCKMVHFPRDKERYDQWVDFCQNPSLRKCPKICTLHFEEKLFMRGDRSTYLIWSSKPVPTLRGPHSSFKRRKKEVTKKSQVASMVVTKKPPENTLKEPKTNEKLLNGVINDNSIKAATEKENLEDNEAKSADEVTNKSNHDSESKSSTVSDISSSSKENSVPAEKVASKTDDEKASTINDTEVPKSDGMETSIHEVKVSKSDSLDASKSDSIDVLKNDDMEVSKCDSMDTSKPEDMEVEVSNSDNTEVSSGVETAKPDATECQSENAEVSKPHDLQLQPSVKNNDLNLEEDSLSPGPASVLRTTSVESEDQASTLTRAEAEPLDEDSSNSVNSLVRFSDETRKRLRAELDDDLDYLSSGNKRIRLEKTHCSDGEQDQEDKDKNKAEHKERRRSYSEEELMKDLSDYNRNHSLRGTLKNDKWKAPELTPEEKKRLELANAREKKMRENVLRVIQRNYKSMSVEDFEDGIYVAIMDYFCHYNADALLQRKVLMLEKLVSKLQENYNRTFKQYCEAKYLLKRMVDIRKEDVAKCVCKDKLPFRLVRSVAVQVQTARCRGGDLCPGSSVGLDPNFKNDASTSKASTSSPRKPADSAQPSNSADTVIQNGSPSKGSQPAPNSLQKQPATKQISVSVPAAQNGPQAVVINQKTAAELPNGKVPIMVQSPPSQRTILRQIVPQQTLVKSSLVKPFSQTASKPNPNSVIIDLTDKDEDTAGASVEEVTSSLVAPSKNSPINMQQPFQTKVVKTSVLSPMPQLPPLPAAPLYKSIVRRPPQPVLKVCKADQSGIMLSWNLRSNVPLTNEITVYQVYACQENAGISREWSSVGDVKALPLPMACTLSQFREGHRYHFVVRAMDKFNILGEFSHPASILLVSKTGSATNALSANSQPPSTSPPLANKAVQQRQWAVNNRRGR